jgi:Tfp pilus assembly protein FimT
MDRRVTIGVLLVVGVGVLLGMTVVGSNIAQATGLAQSVTVNNTAANPVPVTDDHTNITIHAQSDSGTFTNCLNNDIYTVPAGKQFVAEFVSINSATGTSATTANQAILYNSAQGEFNDFASFVLTRGTLARWAGSQTIDLVFPSGATVGFEVQPDAATQCVVGGVGAAVITVGGYLEPAP